MRHYHIRNQIFILVIAVLIIFAPYDRFFVNNHFTFWPYFNWELGFGSVPFTAQWEVIFIDQVDDVKFDPPITLQEFVQKNGSAGTVGWIKTQDYKIQTMLAQANFEKDAESLERVKKLIANKWLNALSDRQVFYHLGILEIDPIIYSQTQKWLSKKVDLEVKYVK